MDYKNSDDSTINLTIRLIMQGKVSNFNSFVFYTKNSLHTLWFLLKRVL